MIMPDEKFVRIGISIDKAGAQQAAQTVGSVRKEFDTIKLASTQAGAAAQQAGRVTDLGWKPVRATIQDVRDDVDEARSSFQTLSKVSEGSSSFFRGISGLAGGPLGEIAQTSRQI